MRCIASYTLYTLVRYVYYPFYLRSSFTKIIAGYFFGKIETRCINVLVVQKLGEASRFDVSFYQDFPTLHSTDPELQCSVTSLSKFFISVKLSQFDEYFFQNCSGFDILGQPKNFGGIQLTTEGN